MIAPLIPFEDRSARLAEIRRQIEADEFETAERWTAALDALLDRLFPAECLLPPNRFSAGQF